MRFSFAAIVIALLLSACQTLPSRPKPQPLLAVGLNEGAASIKLCSAGTVPYLMYGVSIVKIDSVKRSLDLRRSNTEYHMKEINRRLATFQEKDRTCRMWQFASSPGSYAIASFHVKHISTINIGTPRKLLRSAYSAAARKGGAVVFFDRSGSLTNNAASFEIQEGRITQIGTFFFRDEFSLEGNPLPDPSGYWDGQTTDMERTARVTVSYEALVEDEPDHGYPIIGNVRSKDIQVLVPLMGRDFVFGE